MLVDYAFVATPAKARLLLSLQQYENNIFGVRLSLDKQITELAKQNLYKNDSLSVEQKQAYQFLYDMGDRAAILKNMIDSSFYLSDMINAAISYGHNNIIIFSKSVTKAQAAARNFKCNIEIFEPFSFISKNNFQELVKQYRDYLIIYDYDHNGAGGFLIKSIFRHFEKIWIYAELQENWNFSSISEICKTIPKNHIKSDFNYAIDLQNNLLCYGILLLNSDRHKYYPKLEF